MKRSSWHLKPAIVASAAVLALVLAACSGGTPSVSNSGENAGPPKRGGTLLVGEDTQPASGLDPMMAQALDSKRMVSQFYEGLLSMNSDFTEVQPGLATEWKQTSETIYEFTLRNGAKFHDGELVKPSDVVFSLNRVSDLAQNSPYKRLYSLKSVTETGPETVQIELAKPQASLLSLLAQPWSGGIVSEAWVTSHTADQMKTMENGTGPFVLSEFQEGAVIKTVRFEDYWDEQKPYLDGVDYRLIPAEATRVQALSSGSIDMMEVRSPVNAESLRKKGVTVGPEYNIGAYWLGMDTLSGPLSDPKVRQAVNLGIDRDQLIQVAAQGVGTLSYAIAPADPFGTDPGQDAPFYKYDPEAAKKLLADAGKTSVSLKMVVRSDNPKSVSTAELIKQQLSGIGVDLEIRTVPFSQIVSSIGNGNWDADMLQLNSALNADPSQYLDLWFAKGAAGTKVNDPVLWQMMEDAAQVTTGNEDRKKMYDDISIYIAENSYMLVPYAAPIFVDSWSSKVKGFDADLSGTRLFLKDAWIN
ncbi:ABC transporter substrate-binding protein [Rhodococcus sp. IEGM 1241]|uniref:ABC transporter substrate-binding protein n=1 Tax=Rhodococcus sp. IEGM 1241 TaxID=3082228 RepID=UPI0029530A07|nr:ABC transporter substrate-binding protein [Rhodococcus sp. IEGM 1241]MDV8015706.1 ABC transporter substrate-binding protein [Rhodococcus sp. IEGM 1241]